MANLKYDGVVEAVRYSPEGQLKLVRVYLRRGATWSDRMLLTRGDFLDILKTGKKMMIGKRIEFMAGTFDVSTPVQVKGADGQETIYAARALDGRDNLEGAPIF